jgi:serine protease
VAWWWSGRASTGNGSQTQYSRSAQGAITNPTGQFKGTWSDSSAIARSPTQSQLGFEASTCESHYGFSGDANSIVATPTGRSQSGFGTQWCAYRTASTTGGTIAWTYLPYVTDAGASRGENFVNSGSAGLLDGVSIVGGHEYAEAMTDPHPCTGLVHHGRSETGDSCAWKKPPSADVTLPTGTFAAQGLWSSSANACVISG